MSLTDQDKSWITDVINTAINASETRLAVALEKARTALLTEFKWASPMDMRVKSQGLAIGALDLETEALNGRVAKLEPPH